MKTIFEKSDLTFNGKGIDNHLRCKCKNEKCNLIDIEEDFPIDKITKYLFVDINKQKMMKSIGCIAYPYGKIKIATPLIKD